MEKLILVKYKMADFVKRFIKDYGNSAISAYSGQGAFFFMLSFFPFMLFFLSLIEVTPLTKQDLIIWMSALIPEAFTNILNGIINEIYSGNTRSKISMTIIMAIYLSSKSFLVLQQGLNSMYQIKDSRNAILLRVYSIFYSIIFAIVMVVVLGFLVFGNKIGSGVSYYFPIIKPLVDRLLEFRVFISMPVLVIFFMVIYIFLPDWRHSGKTCRIRNQIPGAIFSASGWVILSAAFSAYVNHSNYSSFYGTMTTIALIMVWLYWCMYIVFIGGIINK